MATSNSQTSVTGSTGTHTFASIPKSKTDRSTFNRSHSYKTTFDSGLLIPFYFDEVLPGDTVNLQPSVFARMGTPLRPTMDGIHLDWFFFAVPLRLLWDNFEKFMGERTPNTDSSIDFLTPKMTIPALGFDPGSTADYFGIPPLVPNIQADAVNAFPFRAYNLIYNEWFRDENLIDQVPHNMGDGPDLITDYDLLRRGKRHDYFTSALPFAQKGDPVTISLGSTAAVVPTTANDPSFQSIGTPPANRLKGAAGFPGLELDGNSALTGPLEWGVTGLEADLSTANPVSINELRLAFATQQLLEQDARGGTRYQEIILSHFGVTSDDARLQRPEYLGGGTTKVNQAPVANTVSLTGATPLGLLGGYATAASNGKGGFTRSFTEHQVLIGLVQVRADLTYSQGINRKFSRSTRYDYFWPAFAHLGEQAIKNQEIYVQGTAADDLTFGYQERWAEYRYNQNLITGKFRPGPGSLDIWHVAQEFGSLPALNAAFIDDTPPIERVVAIQTEPEFLFDAFLDIKHVRPLPVYSVPGLTDRF